MGNSIFMNERLTDKNLIESVLASFYILDYGYIKAVNPDKTVDVTHAKRLKTTDGTTLNPTVTKNIEMLTIAGSGFSLQFDYKKGDKVLLLGLKDYIPKVEDVTSATETTTYQHYSRETIKALPLCVFNDDAKVVVKIENGDMAVDTSGKIKLNGDSKQLVTWSELNTALSNFLADLTIAMTTTPIAGNGAPQPTWTNMPTQIDISAAKTTTVVTGG
jgi:hypothetical protein